MTKIFKETTWLALMGVLAVGCGGTSAADQTRITAISALTADTTNGKTLYTTTCTPCHGDNGKSGSENKNVASDASSDKEGAIEQVIAGGGSMPAYGSQYTDQEIADLIGYLASLK